MLGREASLFCVSGCMTNQLGLRTLLTQPPHSVLCDARSHVYNYESGGIAYHSQASVSPVMPKNGVHLTLDDVTANLVVDELHGAVTKVISLENTLDGTIMPLSEIKRIHAFAQQNDMKMHLDGARLWNASQATGIPLDEYAKYFDTISVCLSKGIGAPIGSMIAGSRETIKRARIIRKLMGGGWRQAGPLAVVALHCLDTVIPTIPETHRLTSQLADRLQALGMGLALPVQTNMIFLDTTAVGLSIDQLAEALLKKSIRISPSPGTGTRIVLHYQIDQQVVDTFVQVAEELVQQNVGRAGKVQSGKNSFYPSSRT